VSLSSAAAILLQDSLLRGIFAAEEFMDSERQVINLVPINPAFPDN
jgi:hypothetical protein